MAQTKQSEIKWYVKLKNFCLRPFQYIFFSFGNPSIHSKYWIVNSEELEKLKNNSDTVKQEEIAIVVYNEILDFYDLKEKWRIERENKASARKKIYLYFDSDTDFAIKPITEFLEPVADYQILGIKELDYFHEIHYDAFFTIVLQHGRIGQEKLNRIQTVNKFVGSQNTILLLKRDDICIEDAQFDKTKSYTIACRNEIVGNKYEMTFLTSSVEKLKDTLQRELEKPASNKDTLMSHFELIP